MSREQAEKAAEEVFPGSATPSTAELLRMGFVRGVEWREALLPSVEEVADMLNDLDVSDPDLGEATYTEQAQAVLDLIKGVDTAD